MRCTTSSLRLQVSLSLSLSLVALTVAKATAQAPCAPCTPCGSSATVHGPGARFDPAIIPNLPNPQDGHVCPSATEAMPLGSGPSANLSLIGAAPFDLGRKLRGSILPPVLTHRWTGRRRDGETGWDYIRNRQLHPSIGRFTTEDPMGDGATKPTKGISMPTSAIVQPISVIH
jgi:RHS repeat-associated protein